MVHHPIRLAVVDLARGAHQPRVFGEGGDNEPWIDGDAMAANARTGVEDVDARVPVGEPDQLPGVDAGLLGDDRKLVGKGDVDVAKRILDQHGHLGRRGIGGDHLAADELGHEGGRYLGGSFVDATDDAVVLDQFGEDTARQHPFRAMGDEDVLADRVPGLGEDARNQVLGGADRARLSERMARPVASGFALWPISLR